MSGGKSKRVSPEDLARSDIKKFKKRTDLLTFAMSYPGALTAHFSNAVRVAMTHGAISKTKQLRDVPLVRYVQADGLQLTELRDRREALTLATVLEHINSGSLAKALDVITMRLLALQEAKAKSGTWDKAQQKELIPLPGGSGLQPAGLSSMS